MSKSSSPAEMQAQIFEKLIAVDREKPEKNKDLERFSRQIGEALGGTFKELLYHKVETKTGVARIEKIAEALRTRSAVAPLCVVTDEMEAAHALLHFDYEFAPMLSRFLLGGDLEATAAEATETLT
ncbi:MAG: hypothetical protein ACR2PF_17845, partial [Rhizobiaceae bacterium]